MKFKTLCFVVCTMFCALISCGGEKTTEPENNVNPGKDDTQETTDDGGLELPDEIVQGDGSI